MRRPCDLVCAQSSSPMDRSPPSVFRSGKEAGSGSTGEKYFSPQFVRPEVETGWSTLEAPHHARPGPRAPSRIVIRANIFARISRGAP